MNKIAEFIKINRKAAGLTQEEFAMFRTGASFLLENWNREKRLYGWIK